MRYFNWLKNNKNVGRKKSLLEIKLVEMVEKRNVYHSYTQKMFGRAYNTLS